MAPVLGAYVPAGHDVHRRVFVVAEYVPFGHCVQDDDPADDEFVPSRQSRHAVAEAEEYEPAGHTVHEAAFTVLEMLPDGHCKQSLLPAVEHCLVSYDPAAQLSQSMHPMSELELQSAVLYWLAGHTRLQTRHSLFWLMVQAFDWYSPVPQGGLQSVHAEGALDVQVVLM